MSLLEVSNVSHAFGDKVLYKQVFLEVNKGEHVGVVGQNGTGKSTLIGILTGEVIPDGGTIKWQPNIKIGHLDQYAVIDGSSTVQSYLRRAFTELYEMEEKMNALYAECAVTGNEVLLQKAADLQERLEALDYYSIESNISKVVTGLGLNAMGMDRPIDQLSGGQRTKVILAKLLLEQPDVLLLDEPTNYLDTTHINWLAEYLIAFDQAFIVVSHNYTFLDKISTSICDIEGETIKKYHGKYADFLRQKEHFRESHIRQYHAQQKKIEATEQYIRKNGAGVNSRIARGRQKQLDRMERIAAPTFVTKASIRFQELPVTAQVALRVDHLVVGYDKPLLPKLTFPIRGGQKIVIAGFNGIGKSTLLKTLVGQIPCVAGAFRFAEQVSIGYYEQDLIWENDSMTPIEIVASFYPKLTIKEIRRHLALCVVKDSHVTQPIRTLSGGEQSKVKLCLLLLTACNFLILDEPTNHLDAETKDALQNALIQFKGTVILVSHEEQFYQGWVDRVINIVDENRNRELKYSHR
ncbi:ABC-F family ATP-binding cassette domain-containing protein [Paenibacillus sp. FSL E2-0202]|uniref:ABC-F family ATP-binding cassette domain-containing protein n=1 Tax=Paenibacillus sp. FSL E2-0202 TaxID=2954505 RepID=UPI0030EEE0D4